MTMDPQPHSHAPGETCEHCLVAPPKSKSALAAWIIAGISTTLLILVYFTGIGTSRGTLLASGGFALAGVLICPLVMGGMMWFMMRRDHGGHK